MPAVFTSSPETRKKRKLSFLLIAAGISYENLHCEIGEQRERESGNW